MAPHRMSRRTILSGLVGAGSIGLLGGFDVLQGISAGVAGLTTLGDVLGGIKMSESEEESLGDRYYPDLIQRSGGAYPNTAVQRALRDFAEPIFARSKHPAFRYQVTVIDDNTPNAWALPGGKIGVNIGALRYAANADELAAILSHEMGHIEGRHLLNELHNREITKDLQANVATAAPLIKAGGAGALVKDSVVNVFAPVMLDMISRGYSPQHEYDADANILPTYKETGYHPPKASGFFKTLLAVADPKTTGTTSFFNGHPETAKRIAKIDAAATKQADPASDPTSPGWTDLKTTFPTRVYYRRHT